MGRVRAVTNVNRWAAYVAMRAALAIVFLGWLAFCLWLWVKFIKWAVAV